MEKIKTQTKTQKFDENNISEKIIDHIGIYENAFTSDECDEIIKRFDKAEGASYTFNGRDQFSQGKHGRHDHQIFLEHINTQFAVNVMKTVTQRTFNKYVIHYPELDHGDPLGLFTSKIQKTEVGGGYHIWHSESNSFDCRDRVVVWMLYLNDIPIENGGATEFIYQKLSIQPKKGTLVLWPATYTHTHRGGFLTGDTPKYIATGWYVRMAHADTNL